MRNIYSVIAGLAMAISGVSLISSPALAVTYTAVVSGNFSNGLTWGGTAPTNLVAGDVLIIPIGVVVTLDNTVTMSSASTLAVDGQLVSSTNPTALIMAGGALSGTGAIVVDSLAVGAGSAFSFTGSVTADALSTTGNNITSSCNLNIAQVLHLVSGSLNIANGGLVMGDNSTVVIDGASLQVSGTGSVTWCNHYSVVYQGSPVTTGVELTGVALQNVTLNLGSGAVTLGTNLSVGGVLTFQSGNLALNGHDLTFEPTSNLHTTGTGYIESGFGSSIYVNANNGFYSTLNFGAGTGLVENLLINLGNPYAMVNLGSDLMINGTLTLGGGSLRLAGNDLTFLSGGNIAAGGTGTIMSDATSDIAVMASNSFSGSLRFNLAGNTVNNFIMNMPGATSIVPLGTDLNVNGLLVLGSGLVDVQGHNLSVLASGGLNGGSENSYVIADGTGTLTQTIAPGNDKIFPVGTPHYYAPAQVAGNFNCMPSSIRVGVEKDVLSAGTAGTDLSLSLPLVDATWHITSNLLSGLDLDVTLMWASGMEVNEFDNGNAYVSRYTGMNWDVASAGNATYSNGLYALTRANVTQLSPMMITDHASPLGTRQLAAASDDIELYPNPSTSVLRFSTAGEVTTVDILDMAGRKVQSLANTNNSIDVSALAPGYYTLQLTGKNFSAVRTFVKAQ
ncbi:MAG: T9SS type A sorting domain-containing protein [Flavipsychrobacter sp.]|nr:T9SS type A sorting domain-containing protein [Flavipsychrobacter sp.]